MIYEIWSKGPGNPFEKIDEFEELSVARAMLDEYHVAFGRDWILEIRHVKEQS